MRLSKPFFFGPRVQPWLYAVCGAVFIFSFANEALAMRVLVSCPTTGKVEQGMDKTVCHEVTARLTLAYPDVQFAMTPGPAKTAGQMALAVEIRNATAYGLGLTLIWTTPAGQDVAGELLTVSSLDRAHRFDLRHGLYYRAIAASPLPR